MPFVLVHLPLEEVVRDVIWEWVNPSSQCIVSVITSIVIVITIDIIIIIITSIVTVIIRMSIKVSWGKVGHLFVCKAISSSSNWVLPWLYHRASPNCTTPNCTT